LQSRARRSRTSPPPVWKNASARCSRAAFGEMDGKAKETLGAALKESSEPALVQSAFDLPASQRATIQNALNETFSAEIRVRFETAPDAICGIELTASGQKIGWSIADYLKSLDQKVGALLDAEAKPEAKAAPSPIPANYGGEDRPSGQMRPRPTFCRPPSIAVRGVQQARSLHAGTDAA
jgi:hypothetical protein